MKKKLLISSLLISTTSICHEFMTDFLSESVGFDGFGFVLDDVGILESHTIYALSKMEIIGVFNKIVAKEALRRFVVTSNYEGIQNNPVIHPQDRNEYSNVLWRIPYRPNYWEYSHTNATSDGDFGDGDDFDGGPHHDDGIFDPDTLKAKVAANHVCGNFTETYGSLVVPFFLGPESFSTLTPMDEPPLIIPVIADEHHGASSYSLEHGIVFKCVYNL